MIGSIAQIATICWAAMSSGLAITDSDSMAPICIRPATTAAEIRSPRNLGNITPWLGAPTWCPARPIRCSPLATDGGDSTWITRSTAPMSMPSSSDEVATTAGSRPVFELVLDQRPLLPGDRPVVGLGQHRRVRRRRCRTAPSPGPAGPDRSASARSSTALRAARRGSRSAARSAARPAGGSWRTRSSSGATRSGRRPAPPRAARSRCGRPPRPPCRSGRRWSCPARSCPGTGTTTSTSICLVDGGWTTVTGRPPARNRATSSTGRTVADSPIRCAGRSSSASSRSSETARCAPRLVPATACTSSMMTVRTPVSISRARLVSSRNSDSGVVIRMSAPSRAKTRRSPDGVSPERTATEISGRRRPRGAADRADPGRAGTAGSARRRRPAP